MIDLVDADASEQARWFGEQRQPQRVAMRQLDQRSRDAR